MSREYFLEKSFWPGSHDYRPGEPLTNKIEVDGATIGGGFTGLSTAYHLKAIEPDMKIALLESQVFTINKQCMTQRLLKLMVKTPQKKSTRRRWCNNV